MPHALAASKLRAAFSLASFVELLYDTCASTLCCAAGQCACHARGGWRAAAIGGCWHGED